MKYKIKKPPFFATQKSKVSDNALFQIYLDLYYGMFYTNHTFGYRIRSELKRALEADYEIQHK